MPDEELDRVVRAMDTEYVIDAIKAKASIINECRRARAEAASLRGARMADDVAAGVAARLEADGVGYTRADHRADLAALLADRAHLVMLLSDRIAETALADEARRREHERILAVLLGLRDEADRAFASGRNGSRAVHHSDAHGDAIRAVRAGGPGHDRR